MRVLKGTLAPGQLQLGFIFHERQSLLVIFFPDGKAVTRDQSRFILHGQRVRVTLGSLTPTMHLRSHQALKANPLDLRPVDESFPGEIFLSARIYFQAAFSQQSHNSFEATFILA